jgi:hypothetical protein
LADKLGVIKESPIANGEPPVDAAYQATVLPVEGTALKITAFVPHAVSGLTEVGRAGLAVIVTIIGFEKKKFPVDSELFTLLLKYVVVLKAEGCVYVSDIAPSIVVGEAKLAVVEDCH